MRILGLDLSLQSTGYVLLDDQVLEDVVWSGRVDGSDVRDVERLRLFDEWIRSGLKTHKPDVCAIESYAYGMPQGLTRAFSLGELGGVIKLAVAQARIPIHLIASNTWKMKLCGRGRIDKRDATMEIFKRYGVEFPSQDTLDAWAVAMTLRRQLLGLDKPAPKVKKPKAVPRSSIQNSSAATTSTFVGATTNWWTT